jgi:tripartite-type tricarboxylate transporter receptor subunit TctC
VSTQSQSIWGRLTVDALVWSAVAVLCMGQAWAQPADTYPAQPVRILVGFPPGGPTDIMSRELAKGLQDYWRGQSVLVDNKPGAASQIAAVALARATPDGYTLILGTDTPLVVLPFLRAKLDYDPVNDFTPIAMVGAIPTVLVASPAAGVRTYAEFIAAAKASPGKLNYASNGVGAGLHIAMERLQRAAGIALNHVPYKGSGPALIDMVGGQVSLMWDTVPSSLPLIRSGKLVPLAVGGAARSPQLPEVSTIAELAHPGFDVDVWMGLLGPKGLPPAIVEKAQNAVRGLLDNPSFRDRLLERGFAVRYAGAAEFAARIRADYARNESLFAGLSIRKE